MPVPTPFAVGPVNLYLIEGEPLTLVDAGPRTDGAYAALVAGLSDLGYGLSDIEQVVVTHSHPDHIGQVQRIEAVAEASVLSHEGNFYWLVDWEVEWARRLAFYAVQVYQAGLPDEQVAALRDEMAPGIRLGASISEQRVRLLREGDSLRAGGADWSVLHMPGHASGHIVLYQPESGIILAGDALLARISSNPVLEPPMRGESARPRSLVEYLHSLQRLADLDAWLTLTGHGPPIADHRRLVAERVAMHQGRLGLILDLLAGGRRDVEPANGQTAYQICQAMFPGLSRQDIFLGISEVIGHLDVLENQGRVVAEKRGGLLYYFPG